MPRRPWQARAWGRDAACDCLHPCCSVGSTADLLRKGRVAPKPEVSSLASCHRHLSCRAEAAGVSLCPFTAALDNPTNPIKRGSIRASRAIIHEKEKGQAGSMPSRLHGILLPLRRRRRAALLRLAAGRGGRCCCCWRRRRPHQLTNEAGGGVDVREYTQLLSLVLSLSGRGRQAGTGICQRLLPSRLWLHSTLHGSGNISW